jgi:MoaA/NifB/PqqE/SkfB family radical SAM enzyme
VDFIFKYTKIIIQQRKSKNVYISFTGGEPTVHPKFIELSRYVRNRYTEEYADKFNLCLDLTTNGAMSSKVADAVIENFDHVTVSYHAEAYDQLKSQVKDRIVQFNNSKIQMKVNLMLHSEYFEECKSLIEFFNKNNVTFIPRVIGESADSAFAQKYTQEQIDWFKQYWGNTSANIGRPCCGGRKFKTIDNGVEQEVKFINYRNFKGWHCSVNWFFLHVEQQTGLVYHHQTCQAKLDGTRGHIGILSNTEKIIEELADRIINKTMSTVICPNTLCGCGLCVPKSKHKETYNNIIENSLVDTTILEKNE